MAPRPRWQNTDQERRDLILKVATQEFAEHGYTGASLNRILATTSISKGVFYYYFDDKLDLFITTAVAQLLAVTGGQIPQFATTDADAFWHDFGVWMGGVMRDAMLEPERFEFLKTTLRLPPEIRHGERMTSIMLEFQGAMTAVLDQGRRANAVRSDLPDALLASLIIAVDETLDHWFFARIEEGDMPADDAMVAVYIDMMRRLLQP